MRLTAIVTGGSAGIGTETVRLLAARPDTYVVLACRDVEKGVHVAAGMEGSIVVRQLDLADLSSIHAFVETLDPELDTIDVLVNNAGVMGGPFGHTADGFERQIGTNHLGHFALTGLLLSRLLAAPAARVVTVTSITAKRGDLSVDHLGTMLQQPDPYEPMQSYANSKLANQLFTAELDRRAKAAGTRLISVAAHPGVSATGIFSASHRNKGQRVLPWLVDNAQKMVFQSARKGAACSVVAATDPALRGGELVGPDGIREWRGKPTTMPLHPMARNEALARELWKLSERWTSVMYAFESG